jgi:hypothetical protein
VGAKEANGVLCVNMIMMKIIVTDLKLYEIEVTVNMGQTTDLSLHAPNQIPSDSVGWFGR